MGSPPGDIGRIDCSRLRGFGTEQTQRHRTVAHLRRRTTLEPHRGAAAEDHDAVAAPWGKRTVGSEESVIQVEEYGPAHRRLQLFGWSARGRA